MSPQEITVGSSTTIDVTLLETSFQIGEVVVTALGIKREEKLLDILYRRSQGKTYKKLPVWMQRHH